MGPTRPKKHRESGDGAQGVALTLRVTMLAKRAQASRRAALSRRERESRGGPRYAHHDVCEVALRGTSNVTRITTDAMMHSHPNQSPNRE